MGRMYECTHEIQVSNYVYLQDHTGFFNPHGLATFFVSCRVVSCRVVSCRVVLCRVVLCLFFWVGWGGVGKGGLGLVWDSFLYMEIQLSAIG
jgi:hypothetical protein